MYKGAHSFNTFIGVGFGDESICSLKGNLLSKKWTCLEVLCDESQALNNNTHFVLENIQ